MAPRRSIQQAIGDRGERAFAAALPDLWIPRSEDNDYGIDFSVEIVNPDGTLPGLRFLAQVKSTASEDRNVIERLSFDLEWLEYYRGLGQPVLLARYSAADDEIFVRWAHGVHLHNASGDPPRVSVQFDDTHRLAESTPEQLASDVVEFRYWKQEIPTLPLSVNVTAETGAVVAARMATMLRNAPNRPKDLLSFRTGPKGLGDISLVVSSDQIVVSAAELASMTIHFEGPPRDVDSAWLIESIRASLAVVMSSLARDELATEVLGRAHRLPIVDASPDLAHRVSEMLWQTGDYSSAEDIWRRVAYTPDHSIPEQIPDSAPAVVSAFIHALPQVSAEASEHFIDELWLFAERLRDERRTPDALGVYLALGEVEFGRGSFRSAFRAMARARRLEPQIDAHPGLQKDMAATLFELGRYRAAEALYTSIFETSPTAMTLCRKADVQLFSGRYCDSVETFTAAHELAVSEQQPFESVWVLRTLIAMTAHRVSEAQARNPSEALAATEDGNFERAIELDALCAAAWSRNAEAELDDNDVESAFTGYAVAAGLDSMHLSDAVAAVVLGIQMGVTDDPMREMIVLSTMDVAIHRHGVDKFVEALEDRVEGSSEEPSEHERLVETAHQLLSTAAGEGSTSRWADGGRLFILPTDREATQEAD